MLIDNTPFPLEGARAESDIILEYSSSSSDVMSYNLRAVSIYMGIISMVVSFAIGMLTYLSVKVNKDIKKKFEQEDSDEEGEESSEGEEGLTEVDLKK